MSDPSTPLEPNLQALTERVDALQQELTELRASLAREIRTERLVIDVANQERIVLESVDDRTVAITVVANHDPTNPTHLRLLASSDEDGMGPSLAVEYWHDGNVVGTMESSNGGPITLFQDQPGP